MTTSWLPSMSSDDRVLALEQAVADVFAIHEVSVRARGQVVVFAGQYLRSPELVYETARERLRRLDFIPVLRREADRELLIAYPAPAVAGRERPWVNVALFLVTVLSTLMAGTMQALPAGVDVDTLPELGRALVGHWWLGVPFTVALLGILGVHELGHYFTARRYGLDVTLPYFIPFPINYYTGTLGAVIRIRSPFESRRALFDVGIAGPLAGLVVAIPVVLIGLRMAEVAAVPPGAAVTFFQEPLLFRWLAGWIHGPRPPGTDLMMNPLLMAGWWGFFITALNLLPVSQLDGGHIAYATFGRWSRHVAWGAFLLALGVSLVVNLSYLVMLMLVLFMGVEHPPALNDLTPVGRRRQLLGVGALILFCLLITPDPLGLG